MAIVGPGGAVWYSPCLYKLSTDVLLNNHSVRYDGMGQPRKLKREFMTSNPNLWTGVHCQMLCNSLVDFECSDDTAVNPISLSIFY